MTDQKWKQEYVLQVLRVPCESSTGEPDAAFIQVARPLGYMLSDVKVAGRSIDKVNGESVLTLLTWRRCLNEYAAPGAPASVAELRARAKPAKKKKGSKRGAR